MSTEFDKELDNIREFHEREKQFIRDEIEQLKKAKSENDERFMIERDEARLERDKLLKQNKLLQKCADLYDVRTAERNKLLAENQKMRDVLEICHRRMKHTAWTEDDCFYQIEQALAIGEKVGE
jgi:hypothetical protein